MCFRISLLPTLAALWFLVSVACVNAETPAPPSQAAPPVEPAQPVDPDEDLELAAKLERGFKKLSKRVEPSVVSLEVQVAPGSRSEEWRRMIEQSGAMPEHQYQGSGVLVDPAGFIITNEHVVHGAAKILVKLMDGRVFPAEITGTDPRSDLAMLKLTGENVPKDLPSAIMADSDKVDAGQWVMAVGNPFGLSNTLTVGVVSANGRSMPVRNFSADVFYGNLIQTDAAINPGNSGGPLFDMRGKLIGINTMIFSRNGFSQGCGFAIPSNHLKPRLAYLKTGREIEYGWLGVKLEDLPPGQKVFKVPDDKGVLVNDVIPNTPADRAGLQRGMVIVNFESVRIGNSQELIAVVNETPVGRKVKLKALDSAGKLVELEVRISKRYSEVVKASAMGPASGIDETGSIDIEDNIAPEGTKAKGTVDGAASAGHNGLNWRGMQMKELSVEDSRKRGGHVEVVRVKKGSPADRAGLYEGAIITEFKQGEHTSIQKINSLDELKRNIADVGGPAAVYTELDGYVIIESK